MARKHCCAIHACPYSFPVHIPAWCAVAVIQNCLIPLAKAHPQPESPYFTAVDLKSVAEFFVDHVIQFFNLFSFVLRQDREQETAYVQNVVEIPYAPALEEGFSGSFIVTSKGYAQSIQEGNNNVYVQKMSGMKSCKRRPLMNN